MLHYFITTSWKIVLCAVFSYKYSLQTCPHIPCHPGINEFLFLNSLKQRLTRQRKTCSNLTKKKMMSYLCSFCLILLRLNTCKKPLRFFILFLLVSLNRNSGSRGEYFNTNLVKTNVKIQSRQICTLNMKQKGRNSHKSWIIYLFIYFWLIIKSKLTSFDSPWIVS